MVHGMLVVGVDPGSNAMALALVDSERGWLDFAERERIGVQVGSGWDFVPEIAVEVLRGWSVLDGAAWASLEKVGPRPDQGMSSTARFMRAYGQVEGLLVGIGLTVVRPTAAQWKRHMRLTADKDLSRKMAAQLWPKQAHWVSAKVHHNRAEAALIAWAALGMGLIR